MGTAQLYQTTKNQHQQIPQRKKKPQLRERNRPQRNKKEPQLREGKRPQRNKKEPQLREGKKPQLMKRLADAVMRMVIAHK